MKKAMVSTLVVMMATAVLTNMGTVKAVEKNSADQSGVSIYKFSSEETLFDTTSPALKNLKNVSNMKLTTDGSMTTDDMTGVPHAYEGATKYGVLTSDAIKANKSFQSVVVDVKKNQTPGDVVLVESSVSPDGEKWSEWLQPKEGSKEIPFYTEANYVKYRITIIGFSKQSNTTIQNVSLKLRGISKEKAAAFAKKTYSSTPIPKTDKLKSQTVRAVKMAVTPNSVSNPFSSLNYATREGLIGGTTADGHTIHSTDLFVALPSRKALDQTVTINANNHTYTVPVWDLGPINQNDDYWNTNYTYPIPGEPVSNRDTTGYDTSTWGDIPRGDGETYYAKSTDFLNGWTSSHVIGGSMSYYVSDSDPGSQLHPTLTNPNYPSIQEKNNGAEIDLSDGLWNALGMTGNGFVSVTFNWVSQ